MLVNGMKKAQGASGTASGNPSIYRFSPFYGCFGTNGGYIIA
jgi:hypothetical protein